jgi:hypothetical protein
MIGIPKQQYKIEFLFPIIILMMSIFTAGSILQYWLFNRNGLLSLAVSGIGITGAVFYFTGRKAYQLLIFIWSAAQLLIIETKTYDSDSGITIVNSVLNLSQGFKMTFGFSDSLGNGTITYMQVNILAFVFLGMAKILNLSALLGSEISITAFSETTSLGYILPATGIIESRVKLSKEKNWLLTKLNTKEGEAPAVAYALIKPKDNSNLKLKKKQVVYFLLVPDKNMIMEDGNRRENFTTGDWAYVS